VGLGAGSGNSEAEASKQEKLIAELRVLRGTMAAELAKASGAPGLAPGFTQCSSKAIMIEDHP
jgi:hypothetical protein